MWRILVNNWNGYIVNKNYKVIFIYLFIHLFIHSEYNYLKWT